MATPNIVPRADSEGGLGTASKYWASAYIDTVYVGAGKVGRDTHNLIDFSTDNVIAFRVADSDRVKLSDTALFPVSNSGSALGGAANRWADLFLDDGGVINFDNGNVTLTHSNNALTLADGDALHFGTDNDLRLFHTSGESLVQNTVGHLYIQNTADDKDIIFSCDDHEGGVETYFFLDGSRNTSGDQSPYTVFPDGATLALGSDADLRLKHTGSAGTITNNTGDLTIINNTDNGDVIFKASTGSDAAAAYLTLDGSASAMIASKSIYMADSKRFYAGGGGDLAIYHDGTNSRIENITGDVIIQNGKENKDIIFKGDDGQASDSTVATYFFLDGSSATHDGSATTNLFTNWPDKSTISLGTSHDLQIHHDGSNSYIQQMNNATGNLILKQSVDGGDILFQCDDGSGSVATYITLDGSAVKILMHKSTVFTGGGMDYGVDGTGADVIFYGDTAGRDMKWDQSEDHLLFKDDTKLKLGTGGDLEIYHDGSHSRIKDAGTGHLVINATDFVVNNSGDTKNMIIATDGGSVKLYHDNAAKIETTSTGINVTGAAEVAGGAGNGQLDVTRTSGATVGFQAQSAAGVVGTSSNHRLDIKTNGSTRVSISNTGDATFSNNVLMTNLPTSDPTTAGQLWNDSGTLKISAG